MAEANKEAEHLKKEYIYLSRLLRTHKQTQLLQSAHHKPNDVANDHNKVLNKYRAQTSCQGITPKNLVYRPVDKGNSAQAPQTRSRSPAIVPTSPKAQKTVSSPSVPKVRRRPTLMVAKSRYKLQKVHGVSPLQQQTLKTTSSKRPDTASCTRALPERSVPVRHASVRSVVSPAASGRSSLERPRSVASRYKLIVNSPKAQTSKCLETSLTCMGAKRVIRKYKVNNINSSQKIPSFKKCTANQSSSTKTKDLWQTSYSKTHYYCGQKRPSMSSPSTVVSPQWPHFINIGSITYKASKTKLLRTSRQSLSKHCGSNKGSPDQARVLVVRGVTYSLDSSGKTMQRIVERPAMHATPLKRIDVGGKTYLETTPGMLSESPSAETRTFLSRAISRSLTQVRHAKNRKCDLRASRYCMFFNRFGRCNNGDKCAYIHDPEKVAVCTRFLRGTCRVSKCPFSHRISPDKMPVCSFFLRGCCTMDPCPYRHVKVNSNAAVCMDFVRGYCSQGVKCKKQHILICPEFAATGKCSKGSQCRLTHRKRRKPEAKAPQDSVAAGTVQCSTSCSLAECTKKEPSRDPVEPPTRGKLARQPQYISLTTSESAQDTSSKPKDKKKDPSPFKRSGVRIRPSFLP